MSKTVIATKDLTEPPSGDTPSFVYATKGQELELIERYEENSFIKGVWKYKVRDIKHEYDSFFMKDGEVLPKKAIKRIRKTEKALVEYETTFEEYMKDSCYREVFPLASTVVFADKDEGIICGWNSSCNYDVYFWESDRIENVHPSDLRMAK